VTGESSRRSRFLHGLRIVAILKVLLELTKAKITIAVTFSVAMGHFLFTERLSSSVLLPMLGVFLLACGSAALNQVEEARIDACMTRTRNRPIPSGRVRRDWALFVALAFTGSGLYTLASIEVHTVVLLALGLLAVFWYNVVYLLLKRVTTFAVVPGALVGAIPPVIGWVSAGGLVSDETILSVAFFFFVWQIPHFWLLLIRYAKDYEAAGLPSLTRKLAPAQISRITSVWLLAVALLGLLLALSLGIGLLWKGVIAVASFWLAYQTFQIAPGKNAERMALPVFLRLNLYVLVVVAALTGDALA
jgi:protoheme IX farnesyltransferase